MEHDCDVTAIEVHPDGIHVATGDLSRNSLVCVWNTNTMQLTRKFKGKIKEGVACLAFSISGDKLAIVGVDKNHTIVIYSAKTGSFLSSMKGSMQIISSIQFKDDSEFVTVGPRHY